MISRLMLQKPVDTHFIMAFITRMQPEQADELLVEFASYEMRARLDEARKTGRSGWNTPDPDCENAKLKARLLSNLERNDYVDVLNLAAMLLARQRLFVEVILKGEPK